MERRIRLNFTKRFLQSLIITLLLLMPYVLALSASAESYVGYKLEKGSLSFWTPFYSVKLNLSKGIDLSELKFPNENIKISSSCITSFPFLILFATSSSTSANNYTINIGNRSYIVHYPNSLSLYPWSAEVYAKTRDSITFLLKPSNEALKDVSPLQIDVFLKVYFYKPTIDISIKFFNPTAQNITLMGRTIKGVRYGPEVGLAVCPLNGAAWTQGVLYSSNGSLKASLMGIERLSTEYKYNNLSMIFLSYPFGSSRPTEIIGLKAVEPKSNYVSGFTSLNLTPVNKKGETKSIEIYSITLLYPETYIKPEGTLSYSLELILGSIQDPSSLFVYGLNNLYYALEGKNFTSEVDKALKYKELENNVTNLISVNKELKEEIKTLNNKYMNLTKSYEELEGQLTFFKTNNKILGDNIAELSSRLKRCAIREVGLFIVGLLIGIAGGLLMYSIKSGGVIRR